MTTRRAKSLLVKVVTIIICLSIVLETTPLRAFSYDLAAQNRDASPTQPMTRTPPRNLMSPPDDVPLSPGWNLISLPKEPPNTDPTAVFAPIADQFNTIYAYDACNPTDPWQLYDPTAPPLASDLTAVDHTQGLWIESTITTTLPLSGTTPPTTTIQLCQGWNLIGFPLQQARPVAAALAAIAGKYTRVFGYDPTNLTDPWQVYDVNVPPWANDLQQMHPGRGYWVLATENTPLLFANEGPPPTVSITSPTTSINDLTAVTTITDIIGTVESNLLQKWTLSYRPQGEATFTPFFTSTIPVIDDVLAQFDPTLLLNGMYELQLTAVDFLGQVATITIDISVEGEQKIGIFNLSFLDMNVPVVGIPIQIVRTYDSRDKRQGDFGVGWTLDVQTIRIQENGAIGEGWEVTNLGGIIPTFCIEPTQLHIVTVVADNDIFRFRPVTNPTCQQLTPPQFITVGFEPMPGTEGTLQPIGNNNAILSGSFIFDDQTFNVLDFDQYRFTTAEGVQLTIDQQNGLQQMADLNGNTLTINNNGIIHSSGVGITFQRDPQGRITQITDPLANTVTYQYDGNGDLVQVRDQENFTTTFAYQTNHYLDQIIDHEGIAVAAIGYDNDGRVTQSCDAINQCLQIAHDLDNNREIITDPTGRATTYIYNVRGDITHIIDADNYATTFAYDKDGNLLEQIDANGVRVTYTYDSRGNPLSISNQHDVNDPNPAPTTNFTYNSRNQVTSITKPTGAQTNIAYTPNGDITEIRDEEGTLLASYTYGPNGVLTSESDPFGTTFYSDHDVLGNPRTLTDKFGEVTTSDYDILGRITMFTDKGVTNTLAYDKLGRPTYNDYGDDGFINFSYDGSNKQWSTIDSPTIGHIERLTNSNNELQGWISQDGGQTIFDYDAAGRLTQQTDSLGNIIEYSYDNVGRVQTQTLPSGGQITFQYDPGNRLTAQTDELGHTTTISYTPDGAPATIINPRGYRWSYTYTLTSTTIIDPLNRQKTTLFSPNGLPTKQINPDGSSFEIEYLYDAPLIEAEEFPTKLKDPKGRVRTYTYDNFGQLKTATDLAGITYTYSYDDYRLTSITNPLSETVAFTYNNDDEIATVTYPDGGVRQITYHRGLDPDTIIAPSGVTITYSYDEFGFVQSRATSNGELYQFDYTSNGILTQTHDTVGSTQYLYDAVGNLTNIYYPDQSQIQYRYDILDRVIAITVQVSPTASLLTTTYAYDEVGNIIAIRDPLGGLTTRTYDAIGRLITQTLPNNITTAYTYNLLDQVLSVVHRDAQNTILASAIYERTGIGEPTKITREDGTYVLLAYDDALRLSSEAYHDAADNLLETIIYTYDAAGNRTTHVDSTGNHAYVYQNGYKLTEINGPTGNETYTYDLDGRTIGIAREGVTRTLDYDSRDLLTAVTNHNGITTTYQYDTIGRRTRANNATNTRHFLVAPLAHNSLESPHAITDERGALLAGYVYAGEQPLMRFGANGPVYYLPDAMGSIMALADTNGNSAANFHYDSFGNIRQAIGTAVTPTHTLGGDYRFHGSWLESSTGIYHFRARDYDPQTGRFLSRDAADPVFERPETHNYYTFALANPHIYRDPSGFFTLFGLSVSINIQTSLRSIDAGLKRAVIQEVRDSITEAAKEFILDTLLGFLPFKDSNFFKGSNPGDDFEDKAVEIVCDLLFGKNHNSFLDNFYFEVAINPNSGEPATNGLHCNNQDDEPEKAFEDGNQLPNPDFIISPQKPLSLKGKEAWLIGDAKLSIVKAEEKYRKKQKNQWDAMMSFARRHEVIPVVLILTVNGKDSVAQKLIKKASSDSVFLVVLAIRDR